jgi:hypothetical protein
MQSVVSGRIGLTWMIARAFACDPGYPGLTSWVYKLTAISPVGTAENSPGRQSWVYKLTETSPAGTAENAPGRQSWVNLTTRECSGNHPRPTQFSLRPPIAYNPRIICTPNQSCSLIWTALILTRRFGTEFGEGSSHTPSKAPMILVGVCTGLSPYPSSELLFLFSAFQICQVGDAQGVAGGGVVRAR